MKLHLWGTDFRRSPADLRRRLFFGAEEKSEMLKRLLSLGFRDLVYLATCNRIEFYTTVPDYFTDSRGHWMKLLASVGLSEEDFYRGYHLEGKSAVRHLMRVACSLESLVVGEPQILGQLKEALSFSKANGVTVDTALERTFQLAFETAKRVRTETSIGERPVSVATLGFKHLENSETRFPLTHAVVVGRGPISLVALKWLKDNRPSVPVTWVNRSVSVLKNFAEAEGVTLLSLEEFLTKRPAYSHLFTATASVEPIFKKEFFLDSEEPRQVFDFAQPPDVERVELPGLELVQLENLCQEARENREARQIGVQQAEHLIEMALREHILEQKETPVIRDFGEIEPLFLRELAQAQLFIEQEYPQEIQERLKKILEKLVKRNLHLSREHLRLVLRKVAESPAAAALV